MLLKTIISATLALTVAVPASALTIVNIDGKLNASNTGANAVTLALTQGRYEMRFVQDQFTAHNRFGKVSGCKAGANCTTGWEVRARYYFGADDGVETNNLKFGTMGTASWFSTPQGAFDNAASLVREFTIPSGGSTISFYIFDAVTSDNEGGISLSIAAVPEPASWAMLIAGFGLVGAAARRRRAVSVLS